MRPIHSFTGRTREARRKEEIEGGRGTTGANCEVGGLGQNH